MRLIIPCSSETDNDCLSAEDEDLELVVAAAAVAVDDGEMACEVVTLMIL